MKALIKNEIVIALDEDIAIEGEYTKVGKSLFPGIDFDIQEVLDIPEDFIGNKYKLINGEFILNENYEEPIEFEKIAEKREKLKKMTIGELLESEETFGDTGVRGYELGKILVDKFYGGNNFAELKEHRIFLEALFSAQSETVKNKMLTNPDIVKILGNSEKVKLILEKFKK